MIPDTKRSEWGDLLTEKLQVKLSGLSLQLKLNSLKVSLKTGKMSLSDAIVELHRYCSANEKMFESDLKKIFKNY